MSSKRKRLPLDEAVALARRTLCYDPATGIFRKRRSGVVVGRKNLGGYIRINVGNRGFNAHRLAFVFMTDSLPADQVDHINHIRDDNRWSNLRQATNSLNRINTAIVLNKTGIKGIHAHGKSWRAEIVKDRIRYRLGVFATPEEAGDVYRAVALHFFGEFVFLDGGVARSALGDICGAGHGASA